MSIAATLSCFRTSPVLCSASPHPKQHEPTSQNKANSVWWTPLFGWSSDPDYIPQGSSSSNDVGYPVKKEAGLGRSTRSNFGVGCFTEEKAKELRRKTMETSTFHDIMYHSAIASRLASDVSGGRR